MSSRNKMRDLKKLELFNTCDSSELEKMAPYFKKRSYKRGDVVYTTQTSARHFLFVLTGKIKIYRLSSLGKEQIIRLIEPYEFTGELALFEGVRKAHAKALTETELYIIEHDNFKNLLRDNPSLSLKLIEILALRLHLSEEQTSWLSTSTAKERLLIYLNKEAKIVNQKRIVYYEETKRFIASYLGMSSETLSRVLHQLEEEGKIKELDEHRLEIL